MALAHNRHCYQAVNAIQSSMAGEANARIFFDVGNDDCISIYHLSIQGALGEFFRIVVLVCLAETTGHRDR